MAKNKLSTLERTIHTQFTRYGKNAKEWMRKCAVLLPKVAQHEIWRKKRCHSIYDYAAKIAGMSHEQTREALRVMNRIKDKPELVAIAEKKGINAVRAVATIATATTAGFWADIVANSSARGVETLARDYRRDALHVKTSEPGKMQNGVQNGVQNNVQNEGDEMEIETVTLTLPSALARRLDRIRKREDFEKLLEEFLGKVNQGEESKKTGSRENRIPSYSD